MEVFCFVCFFLVQPPHFPSQFVTNDKAQVGVLNGIVQLIGKDEALRKSTPHILKGLYDEDILEEDVLIKWYDKKSKGDTAKIKTASTVFIDWLKYVHIISSLC